MVGDEETNMWTKEVLFPAAMRGRIVPGGKAFMSVRFQNPTRFFAIALAGILLCGARSTGQSPGSAPPSLQTLKAVEYTQQNGASQEELVSYAELVSLINSCRAYAKGISVLPQFHEPILTRGETGMA